MQKMSELCISKLGNQQRIIGLRCFARTINLKTGKTITRYHCSSFEYTFSIKNR